MNMNPKLTVITLNGSNIIEDIFITYEEEENFCEGLADWEINSYTWIGVEDIEDIDGLEFADKNLEKSFFSIFEK
ncbi:MAG: hypothetical protein PVG30_02035 [Gammaproteobacteria bacterium]